MVKTALLFFLHAGSILLLGCDNNASTPIKDLGIPTGVEAVSKWFSPDGCCVEISFSTQQVNGSIDTFTFFSDQLKRKGLFRCDAFANSWWRTPKEVGKNATTQMAMVRYFKNADNSQIVSIVGTHSCDSDEAFCPQNYVVILQSIPDDFPDNDKKNHVDQLCNRDTSG